MTDDPAVAAETVTTEANDAWKTKYDDVLRDLNIEAAKLKNGLLRDSNVHSDRCYEGFAEGICRRPFWPDRKQYAFHTSCALPLDERDVEVLSLLNRCEQLSHSANTFVVGDDLLVIHEELWSQITLLQSVLAERDEQRHWHPDKQTAFSPTLIKHARREIDRIEAMLDGSAQRDAQLRYFFGMVIGVTAVIPLALSLGSLLDIPGSTTLLRGSFVAGAVGAVISVLMRMTTGGLSLRYRAGAAYTRFVGVFRPLIGAVFGVLMYFLIFSDAALSLRPPAGETKRFFFCALVAFIAGFSERFAPDMLSITKNSLLDAMKVDTASSKKEESGGGGSRPKKSRS